MNENIKNNLLSIIEKNKPFVIVFGNPNEVDKSTDWTVQTNQINDATLSYLCLFLMSVTQMFIFNERDSKCDYGKW